MKCLFCESDKVRNAVIPRTTEFNNKVFTYHQCRNCKLVFINPVPQADDYQKMYSKSYHESFYFKEKIADYSYLNPFFEKYRLNNTLLDYGCGDASFLKFFSSKGVDASGTEYDPQLVKRLSEGNSGIRFTTIADFWENENMRNYNYIHLGDVLEHLEEPRKFLKEISEKMDRVNGVIIVEGPLENNRSFAFFMRYTISKTAKIFRPGKKSSHVPYHITFSNAKNQLTLFEECGFETLTFKIFETTWPYPNIPGNSISSVFKFIIAKLSIKISKLFQFAKMGNRFIYIGKLKK